MLGPNIYLQQPLPVPVTMAISRRMFLGTSLVKNTVPPSYQRLQQHRAALAQGLSRNYRYDQRADIKSFKVW